jgi:hypothetical protein
MSKATINGIAIDGNYLEFIQETPSLPNVQIIVIPQQGKQDVVVCTGDDISLRFGVPLEWNVSSRVETDEGEPVTLIVRMHKYNSTTTGDDITVKMLYKPTISVIE